MICVTIPSMKVHNWLLKVEVREGGLLGSFTYENINLIWLYKNKYYILPLIPKMPVMLLLQSKKIEITGQKDGVIFFSGLIGAIAKAIGQ